MQQVAGMKRTGGILILILGAPGGVCDAAGGCDWGMLIIDFFGTWCF